MPRLRLADPLLLFSFGKNALEKHLHVLFKVGNAGRRGYENAFNLGGSYVSEKLPAIVNSSPLYQK